MLVAFHGTFDLTVNCQIFASENLPFYRYVLPQSGGSATA